LSDTFHAESFQKPTDTLTKETFGLFSEVGMCWLSGLGPLSPEEDRIACLHVSQCRSILIEFICSLATLF